MTHTCPWLAQVKRKTKEAVDRSLKEAAAQRQRDTTATEAAFYGTDGAATSSSRAPEGAPATGDDDHYAYATSVPRQDQTHATPDDTREPDGTRDGAPSQQRDATVATTRTVQDTQAHVAAPEASTVPDMPQAAAISHVAAQSTASRQPVQAAASVPVQRTSSQDASEVRVASLMFVRMRWSLCPNRTCKAVHPRGAPRMFAAVPCPRPCWPHPPAHSMCHTVSIVCQLLCFYVVLIQYATPRVR